MPLPSPTDIMRALSAAGQAACPAQALNIAAEIAAYGSIDRAIAALANDEASAALRDLLAYRAALAEQADPEARIARLSLEAQDLDARAAPAWREAAEFAGKARYRQAQGDTDLAAAFLRRAGAAEHLAASLEAEAFALRLEAAALQASEDRRMEWIGLLGAVAA